MRHGWFLLLATLVGCMPPSGGGGGGGEVEAEAPDIAGGWSGTYTITRENGRAINAVGQIRTTLNQRNGIVSGGSQFQQGTMKGNGMFSGAVAPNGSVTMTHTVSLASGGLTYQGWVSADLMSLQGTFSTFNGSVSGTFALRREGPPPPPKPRPAPASAPQPAPPPPPPPPVSTSDVSGTWKMEVTHADGFRDETELTFQQNDKTVTGKIQRANDSVNVRGTLSDTANISFGYMIRRRAEDPGLRILFRGKVESGTSIRGEWRIDGGERGTFVLAR